MMMTKMRMTLLMKVAMVSPIRNQRSQLCLWPSLPMSMETVGVAIPKIVPTAAASLVPVRLLPVPVVLRVSRRSSLLRSTPTVRLQ